MAELPLDAECASFAKWLSEHNVAHQFVEERGKVVLYVATELAVDVQKALSAYMSDSQVRQRIDQNVASPSASSLLRWHMMVRPGKAPVVFVCVVASILIAAVTGFGEGGPLLRALLFADPFLVLDNTPAQRIQAVFYNLAEGQWWRFFSPALLHFNVLHLVFNMMWLWYLGAKVELKEGGGRILGLVVILSFASNATQYLLTGPHFGGMSGVVYGLFGYCWLSDKGKQQPVYDVSPVLFGFMLFWLVLGFTELTYMLGVGKMANGAHLMGLVAGLLAALIVKKARLG